MIPWYDYHPYDTNAKDDIPDQNVRNGKAGARETTVATVAWSDAPLLGVDDPSLPITSKCLLTVAHVGLFFRGHPRKNVVQKGNPKQPKLLFWGVHHVEKHPTKRLLVTHLGPPLEKLE